MARPRELEGGVQVRLKVSKPLLERIDRVARQRHRTEGYPEGNRSAAIRELIEAGLRQALVLRFAEELPNGYTEADVKLAGARARKRADHHRVVIERWELTREATPGRLDGGPVMVGVASAGDRKG